MSNRSYFLGMFALVLFSVSLRAQASAPTSVTNDGDETLAARDVGPQPSGPSTAHQDYAIGIDDVLAIDVWKEPEISRTIPVRPDGKISLPLLDDVQAAGLTPTQLSSEIEEMLRETIVHPQVTVIVTEINSLKIYVLGQVTRAGSFRFSSGMGVMQALSNAGGFTAFAKLKKIYVRRIENGRQEMLPLNFREVLSGREPTQDIRLKPGDTIVVP